jgi:glycosyltransferase involved in cell wall biosynthesis
MMSQPSFIHETNAGQPSSADLHVALLASYIPEHQSEAYRALSRRVARLSILLSTPMESFRSWSHDWKGLDVTVQRTWSIRRRWKHQAGFSDDTTLHIPRDTAKHLSRLRPDVVVSGEFGSRTAASVLYKRRSPNTPLILWVCLSEHTEQGRSWIRRRLRRWLLGYADSVIVNGESGRRYVQSLNYRHEQIFEIPYSTPTYSHSVEPTAISSIVRRSPSERILLGVGRLSQRKGFLAFLKQVDSWCRRNTERVVRLVLIGEGPEADSILQFATPPNLTVELQGQLKHDSVSSYYASADVLVFPTLADEWGLVVNEAMAHGLPVMGSCYSQAVLELCRDNKTGWIFDPLDDSNSAAALDQVMGSSEDELRQMSIACREKIATITPETCADQFSTVLECTLRRLRNGGQRA